MSHLLSLRTDIADLPRPKVDKPAPSERIEGDPVFRTWLQDESFGGKVQTGVWEATPGLMHCEKEGVYEYCLILQGVVEIAEEGHPPKVYRAGDSFVFKPGFSGTWRTVEAVRKVYVIVESPA